MTFEIICDSCNSLLYSGMEIKNPGDLLKRKGGKCSNCGKKLSAKEFSIEVNKTELGLQIP